MQGEFVHGKPHGGPRSFHQKSTCLTQITLGPMWCKFDHVTLEIMSQRKPRTQPCGTSMAERQPHGRLRSVHQKSTCLTRIASGPCVVQIRSRDARNFEPKKASNATVWHLHGGRADTRRTTILSSKVNLPRTNYFRALCGASLVT